MNLLPNIVFKDTSSFKLTLPRSEVKNLHKLITEQIFAIVKEELPLIYLNSDIIIVSWLLALSVLCTGSCHDKN